MTIEALQNSNRRRGQSFSDLAVALGISNSALRRWARRKKRDGSSYVLGAHFIRGRWVLLGKLTPKRIEFIRSGLNLHQPRPAVVKKWKWKSKEERLAVFDQQIQKLENQFDDLPGTAIGRIYKDKIQDKWSHVQRKKYRLLHGKNYPGHFMIEFRESTELDEELEDMAENDGQQND